jgi:alpha-mannosidase
MYTEKSGEYPVMLASTAIGRNIINAPDWMLEKPIELIDEVTGEKVTYQLVNVTSHEDPVVFAAYRHGLGEKTKRMKTAITFIAEDLPPMGYKTYRIMPCDMKSSSSTSIKVYDSSMENRYYKIKINPKTGSVESIYDKELGKELVDKEAPHEFNQYIARSPTDGIEHPAVYSTVEKGKSGPVLGSLIVKGKGVGSPKRTQEITIYDKIKRIDFANRILRDSTPLLEVYFAFPFKIEKPQMKFEATNSVITPIEDQIPGSCTDYYAIQHWVNIYNKDASVTFSSIDAHMVELGGLWPGYVSYAHHHITPPGYGHDFLKPGELKKSYIYSYAIDNNFGTNFQPTHVSDVLFRYSFTSNTENWGNGFSKDFGWAIHTPLKPVYIKGKKEGSLPISKSFFEINKKNILLLNLKISEDKKGIIVRLIETEGKETNVTVDLTFFPIKKALLTNIVEEELKNLQIEEGKVTVNIKPFSIVTIKTIYK